mmetsp:Transcript_120772/g.386686  ORF Transcript_120772/g.386686 Transcript_120772/m.386686 type:complete len:479 (-) Transcript_120772:35-1471(-)
MSYNPIQDTEREIQQAVLPQVDDVVCVVELFSTVLPERLTVTKGTLGRVLDIKSAERLVFINFRLPDHRQMIMVPFYMVHVLKVAKAPFYITWLDSSEIVHGEIIASLNAATRRFSRMKDINPRALLADANFEVLDYSYWFHSDQRMQRRSYLDTDGDYRYLKDGDMNVFKEWWSQRPQKLHACGCGRVWIGIMLVLLLLIVVGGWGGWVYHQQEIPVYVVPYGVLDQAPNVHTAIVAPAGLVLIQHNRPDEAGGASGAIYQELGISRAGGFGPEVTESITVPSDAKLVFYEAHFDVIHVAAPKLEEAQDQADACERLISSYTNVFKEFASNKWAGSLNELRLLPIAGGIFAGSYKQSLPMMTATAVDQALSDLKGDPWIDAVFKCTTIKMCIFKGEEHDDYRKAFAHRGDQGHCHRQPARSTTTTMITTSTSTETTTMNNDPELQGHEPDFQGHEPDFQGHEPDFHSHEPDFSGPGH